MRTTLPLTRWWLVGCLASATTLPAQVGPTPHPLGPVPASSTSTFRDISSIVALSDGRLMVADRTSRQVTLLDGSLASPIVVLDSATGRQNSFSTGSFLFGFRSDSALFYDKAANALVVITPGGAIGRIMVGPPPDADGRPMPLWTVLPSEGSAVRPARPRWLVPLSRLR